MKNIFNIGDKVKMSDDAIKRICGCIPKWYSDDIFTIYDILNEFDRHNYIIVVLEEKIPNCTTRTISSQFLTLSLKEQRKKKLKKLYGNIL